MGPWNPEIVIVIIKDRRCCFFVLSNFIVIETFVPKNPRSINAALENFDSHCVFRPLETVSLAQPFPASRIGLTLVQSIPTLHVGHSAVKVDRDMRKKVQAEAKVTCRELSKHER